SAACCGLVYAISLAENLLLSGRNQTGLVIGGETFTKMLDWTDRSTAVHFGDGAAGVLIEAAETPQYLNEKIQADGQR
ncbi:3-oxoacyl-ACP synthase, partial [Enterococcus faecalis]